MKDIIMTRNEIVKLIKESNGKILSVTFIKRSTGTERTLLCRIGVTSHLHGGDRAYDFDQHALIIVFDMKEKKYKSIPIENIISLRLGGEEVIVQ